MTQALIEMEAQFVEHLMESWDVSFLDSGSNPLNRKEIIKRVIRRLVRRMVEDDNTCNAFQGLIDEYRTWLDQIEEAERKAGWDLSP